MIRIKCSLGIIHPARVGFPLVALGLSIAVLHYRVPVWLLFVSIGLNALFATAAIVIMLFFSPPLWWIVLVGFWPVLVPRHLMSWRSLVKSVCAETFCR
jgi:hypothetical protein